jgi:hypothetical protein
MKHCERAGRMHAKWWPATVTLEGLRTARHGRGLTLAMAVDAKDRAWSRDVRSGWNGLGWLARVGSSVWALELAPVVAPPSVNR